MALAIDGHGFYGEEQGGGGGAGGPAPGTFPADTIGASPLTTTQPNDLIVVFVEASPAGSSYNTAAGYPPPVVTDTAGLTWIHRGSQACYYWSAYYGYYCVDEFWAVSPSPLTNDVIQATLPFNTGNGAVFAVAVSGVQALADPFSSAAPSSSTQAYDSVTTAYPGDMALGIGYFADPYGCVDPEGGATAIVRCTDTNWCCEYLVAATPGVVTLEYSPPAAEALLCFADVVSAAAPGQPIPTTLTLQATAL
jgi:hypothetical protein